MTNPYEWLENYVNQPLDYKKEFCPLMNMEYEKNCTGKRKEEVLKKLNQYMDIQISGRKVLISKVYSEEEVEKIFYEKSRSLIKNPLMEKSFCVYDYKDKRRSGIYKIQLDNKIYIGETKDFYERFRQHWFGGLKHTKELLENGGKFSVIEFMDNTNPIDLKEREEYYIQLYTNNNDYDCINRRKRRGSSICQSKNRYIKISADKYEEACQLLREHGMLCEVQDEI